MGASQSSNVATAVTNLSNFVSNSTDANDNQASNVVNRVNLENCTIKLSGDFNVSESANLFETNNQIVSSIQDANLNNNIQQQMLQQAQSKVGFLGIGYSSASNASHEMINATSQIVNDMNVSANQYSNVNQEFECDNSTIIADNINIGFYSNSDFLSSQTLNNSQTATVVNNVSQKVDQRATATVQGISMLMIGLLAILAVFIYAVQAPLSSGAGKVAVSVALVFVLVGLVSFMYIRQTSPFFAQPANCINNSAIGMGNDPNVSCINMTNQELELIYPPTKYIYGLTPSNSSVSGGNLVQMAIAQISGQSKSDSGPNGGYRVDTYNNLANVISKYLPYANQLGIPNIPNPLYIPTTSNAKTPYYAIPIEYMGGQGNNGQGSLCTPGIAAVGSNSDPSDFTSCIKSTNKSQGRPYNPTAFAQTSDPSLAVANLNWSDWEDYILVQGKYPPTPGNNQEKDKRILFARFVLADIIGNIDLHHWTEPYELVKFIRSDNTVVIDFAGDQNGNPKYPNDTYFYKPNSTQSWDDGMTGSGTIRGQVGVLNDRQYKFDSFMKRIGAWIILLIIIAIFGYMYYKHKKEPVK